MGTWFEEYANMVRTEFEATIQYVWAKAENQCSDTKFVRDSGSVSGFVNGRTI